MFHTDARFPSPFVRRLDNGLRIAVTPMPYTQTTSINVSVSAGSRDETLRQSGVAHFLEHMAFKGTETRTAKDIAEEFDMIGGHLNAGTGQEHTSYYARVLTEHADVAIDILSDIILHSIFCDVELEKERNVILQEIFMTYDSPEEALFEIFQQSCFGSAPMGRSILGTEDHIRGYKSADLTGFMQEHYDGKRMIVSVAGNVDPEAMAEGLSKVFSAVPVSASAPAERVPSPFAGEYRGLTRELDQSNLALALPCPSYRDENYLAYQLLAIVLGGGMSSRLFQEVREKRGLAYSVSAFTTLYSDVGLFSLYGGCSPEKLPEMTQVMLDELRRLADGVQEKERVRALNQVRASMLMQQERSSFVANYVATRLALHGKVDSLSEIMRKAESVTTIDIKNAALSLLNSGVPLARAYVGPEGSEAAAEKAAI
ncbi:MAG: pitrilysin family protein [Rickettsiales bacterium]